MIYESETDVRCTKFKRISSVYVHLKIRYASEKRQNRN